MLGVVPVGTRDPRWFAVDLDVSYTKGSLSLMVHFSVSDTVLASRQLVSGGWSFASSQQASIEATCLAAFALADEMPANAGASTQFLLKSQFADGCWPAFEGDSEGSWTTALSLCYLNGMTDFASAREKASHWLIEERGREAHWFWRWKFKIADRDVRFDPDKYGWPWIPGSASWVIPTAFSVMAIKQFTVCNRLCSGRRNEFAWVSICFLIEPASAAAGIRETASSTECRFRRTWRPPPLLYWRCRTRNGRR